MPDNQDTLNAIRDRVFRKRVADVLGDDATDTTVDSLLGIAEAYVTSVVQEREHYRGVIERMGRVHERNQAIMGLATEYRWNARSDGAVVRIQNPNRDWRDVLVIIDGAIHSRGGSLDAAIDTAARVAPPADADLTARLKWWTACGKARV